MTLTSVPNSCAVCEAPIGPIVDAEEEYDDSGSTLERFEETYRCSRCDANGTLTVSYRNEHTVSFNGQLFEPAEEAL